jgi:parallel beta-helix repeat protein/predicted outer membrane repeat protein
MKPVTMKMLLTGLVGVALVSPTNAREWLIRSDGLGDAATIQAGVDSASAGDSVMLAAGTFTGVGNRDVSFMGKAITVTSYYGAASTIIDCGGLGRGFTFSSGETSSSVLSHVTIRNGFATTGGAVYCSVTNPNIKFCVFANNNGAWGGAVYIAGYSSPWWQPSIHDNRFEGNEAEYSGGGIYCSGVQTLRVSACEFINNDGGDRGGAIDCAGGGTLDVSDCTLIGNFAAQKGGAIYCYYREVYIRDCTLDGNSGGAVHCDNGPVYMQDCVLTNNTGSAVGVNGGYLEVRNCRMEGNSGSAVSARGTPLDIRYSEFRDNTAGEGGAVRCDGPRLCFPTSTASVSVTGCTFRNNSAQTGGGLFLFSLDGQVQNNTFEGNSGRGAGVFWDFPGSSSVLRFNIFTGNNGSSLDCDGGSPTVSQNTFHHNNGSAIRWSMNGSPRIVDNVIYENTASEGGGVNLRDTVNAIVENNLIYSNTAHLGGGIACEFYSNPQIRNNTLVGNTATGAGGGIWSQDSSPLIENNIVAFSGGGGGVACYDEEYTEYPTFACNDIYGNAGGDALCGIDGGGNISLDPDFCGAPGSHDYTLAAASPCLPTNNACGVLMGARPATCRIDYAHVCPADLHVPAYSTVHSLSMVGFRVTNEATFPAAYSYYLTAAGPATLVDMGNPLALAGTTPLLGAGATFYPPEAGLVIPEIRDFVQEFVTYHVEAVGFSGSLDSCKSVVTIEPPVAVFVGDFTAEAVDGAVALEWKVSADEAIDGFALFRSGDRLEADETVQVGGLISTDTRRYLDDAVEPGRSYFYVLQVEHANGARTSSNRIEVKTKSYATGLAQNYPNPFNPSTRIPYTIERPAHVALSIYDVSGRRVRTLVDRVEDAGRHEREWDGRDETGNDVASGVYFVRLTVADRSFTTRAILLR